MVDKARMESPPSNKHAASKNLVRRKNIGAVD